MNLNFRDQRPLVGVGVVLLGLSACVFLAGTSNVQAEAGRVHARDLSATFDSDINFANGTENPFNTTQYGESLFKRADGQLADVMSMTEDVAQHEPYGIQQKERLRINEFIGGNEWTVADDEENYDPRATMPELAVLHNLRGLHGIRRDTVRESLAFDLDSQTWRHMRHVQNKPYGPYPQQTYAYIDSVIDGKGLMIVTGVRSPQFQIAAMHLNQQPPVVNKWSDAVFLQDMYGRRFQPTRQFNPNGDTSVTAAPSWILLKDVYGPRDTLAVISRCLRFHGWLDPHMPDWQHRFTFPIGSACYDAILGTQNSAGIAWLLIEHMYKYGDTMLASVTVYSDAHINTGSPPGDHPTIPMPDINPVLGATEMPNLLWWAGSVKSALDRRNGINLMQMRSENFYKEAANMYSIVHRAQWANPVYAQTRTNFEHILEPAY